MKNGEYTVDVKSELSLEQQAIDDGIDVEAIDEALDEQSPDARPSWLPEKYKTPEELAKAYNELVKKMRSGDKAGADESSDEDDDDVEAEEVETVEEETPEETEEEKAEKSGLDLNSMSERFYENGETLPDDDYAALEKAGITRDVVERFIEGQRALQEVERSNLLAPIGGEEAYAEMSNWAAEALTEKELETYNKAVAGSVDEASKAIKDLRARFERANGSEPKRKVAGKAPSRSGPAPFGSMAEYVQAIKDPRYEKDAAYRAKLDARLALSDI